MSTADVVAHQARSAEGRGLSVRGGDQDKWIEIQKNTFMNWVNIQLQPLGMAVTNFTEDFDDGVRLCALVEQLQKKKIGKVIKKPINQHQSLENVTIALNAIAADNVRLVNIGSEDIVNGSLKLILGLIWHLILRYQIGKTKFPPKKLMLAWLQAVVPDHPINNFTSDWNDGVALHALIDYCQPGLYPNWRQLSRSDRLDNCRQAMTLAKEHFNIPMVVRPEDLASPHLDDLSGMTYLSYYMMSDSPGYHATLREVRKLLKHGTVNNFTTDWNDGRLLCNLVKSLGVDVPGWPNLPNAPMENLQKGIDGGRRLGVEPIFSAKEMADPEVEHLGIMAYAAMFTHHAPAKSFSEKAYIDGNFNTVYVSQEKHFRVSCDSDVNPSDVRVEVLGPDSIPPVRTSWSGNTANCSFVPSETGQHKVNVYCMGDLVSSCPVSFRVSSDRSKVRFLPVDRCSVGQVTGLKVDASGAGQGEIHMEARSPSGRVQTLPVMYRQGLYTADFTPAEVGEHHVSVNYDGEQISGSPFSVYAYDPSLVRVYGLEGGAVGKALTFNADCTKAGDGNLRVNVTHNGSEIPAHISEESKGNHRINFTPHGAGLYKAHVFFEETEIRGSPFTLDIVDSSMVSVSGEGLSLVPVNRAATFTVNTQGAGGGDIKVEVTSPSGSSLPIERTEVGSDLRVEYTPREVGEHVISVRYADTEVTGSPFVAKAYDSSAITVTPLQDGFVGQLMEFTIDVSRAGEGQLQIMVNNGDLTNDVEMERSMVYRITFVPVKPGRQEVDITFNNEPLPDSPFTCEAKPVAASIRMDMGLVRLGSDNWFNITGAGGAKPDVTIYSPDGEQVATRLVPQSDGDYRVEWTPYTAGRHTVDVLFAGQQIEGSPFYIDVFDINKIRLDNFFNGNVGEQAGFHIDSTKAGAQDRQLRITSPSGQNVSFHVEEQRPGEHAVTYYPKEAGTHKINLAYSGIEVPGSPFSQEIGEATLPTAHGEGLYRGEEDKPASFTVDAHECSPGELDVQVDGPNSIAKCSIDPQPNGTYTVTYIPVEVGMFDVTIKWNGRQIHGSPFHTKIVDARKVKVVGGWQHYMDAQERVTLNVDEEKVIPFDTSDAGPGKLTATVKGPGGNVPVRVDDSAVGRSTIHFTPKEEGTHYIHLYWEEHPLDSSPLLGYAHAVHADPSKVILTGRGLKEATVRDEAEFHIDGSQAGPGTPEVHLIGVRAEVNVIVVPEGGGRFRCTYIPTIPGAYLLHINWNGRQLRGSPYKVNVTSAFYPNKVVVTGEGLNAATLGRDCDILIDTRKAGPGELTAYCMGPTRVAYCELEDNHDGTFRLRIKPQETGKHVLQIRYGGENVADLGSPFHIKVTAQPDASKVRVSGPGVEHGILATFQNRFIVETKGAGAGQLTVRIRGPKGAFQVEMYRDSHKDRTILCRYDPTECGLYIISVKWSGVDVPGSPFHVHIVDSQADLERILQSTAYGNASINSGSRSYLGYQGGSQYNGYGQTMLRDEI